jgi:hypothetical protein
VVTQPCRRLHDVRVSVVDDPAFDVRHANLPLVRRTSVR